MTASRTRACRNFFERNPFSSDYAKRKQNTAEDPKDGFYFQAVKFPMWYILIYWFPNRWAYPWKSSSVSLGTWNTCSRGTTLLWTTGRRGSRLSLFQNCTARLLLNSNDDLWMHKR
jgi:hypothetical protein